MGLKENANIIHLQLSNRYKHLSISEKSDIKWGNYIELVINENKKELKMIISKRDLENSNFNWYYLANPNDENSIVERHSNVYSLSNDVNGIFEKNRFDLNYIKNI